MGCGAFTDRREGEPNGIGSPFFDTREARHYKSAPDGCGFALSGFPPVWCPEPVTYEATVEKFGADTFALCPEHAARLRTARFPVTAIWQVR